MGIAVLLGAGVAGGGYLIYRSGKKAKQRQVQQLAEVATVIDEDITEYGERLAQYNISDPGWTRRRATTWNRRWTPMKAKKELAAMRSTADAAKVTTNLEDGRYALACVSARLAESRSPSAGRRVSSIPGTVPVPRTSCTPRRAPPPPVKHRCAHCVPRRSPGRGSGSSDGARQRRP